MSINFDLGHDLDIEFSGSNIYFAMSQEKIFYVMVMKPNIEILIES